MMQAPVITAALLVSPVLMVCLVFCLLAVLLMLILRGGGAKTEMRPDPPSSALPRHRRPVTGQADTVAGYRTCQRSASAETAEWYVTDR